MVNNEIQVIIKDDYITLGQLLKKENIVGSGGEVKIFLAEIPIYVNEQLNNQRGKKLYVNDIIKIEQIGTYVIKKT
jgi:S4 domain protein YaaA